MMASKKVAIYCVIVLFRTFEILHVCIGIRKSTILCI